VHIRFIYNGAEDLLHELILLLFRLLISSTSSARGGLHCLLLIGGRLALLDLLSSVDHLSELVLIDLLQFWVVLLV